MSVHLRLQHVCRDAARRVAARRAGSSVTADTCKLILPILYYYSVTLWVSVGVKVMIRVTVTVRMGHMIKHQYNCNILYCVMIHWQ